MANLNIFTKGKDTLLAIPGAIGSAAVAIKDGTFWTGEHGSSFVAKGAKESVNTFFGKDRFRFVGHAGENAARMGQRFEQGAKATANLFLAKSNKYSLKLDPIKHVSMKEVSMFEHALHFGANVLMAPVYAIGKGFSKAPILMSAATIFAGVKTYEGLHHDSQVKELQQLQSRNNRMETQIGHLSDMNTGTEYVNPLAMDKSATHFQNMVAASANQEITR